MTANASNLYNNPAFHHWMNFTDVMVFGAESSLIQVICVILLTSSSAGLKAKYFSLTVTSPTPWTHEVATSVT
jgi:hypothetical protein